MTKLRPYLPFDASESPMSWATRLAAVHTGESLIPFLNDIGISFMDLTANRNGAIERLCCLTGENPSRVWPLAIKSQSSQHKVLRGHSFTSSFLHGSNTMFCPACLAEDDARGVRPAVQRRGQMIWLIKAVRTCPYHHLPLIELKATVWSHSTRELALRVPETGTALAEMARNLTPRVPSPLQDYVLSRLDGKVGPNWLDSQDIEHAFHATEMLGMVLLFGANKNQNEMNADDWDAAGRAGFEYTCRNEEGVREALAVMQANFVKTCTTKTSLAGPKMIFGRLYDWLALNPTKRRGPIRDVLRQHIIETMDVASMTLLLGERVAVRQRHSVQSLAEQTGTDPRTLRNFLISRGVMPEQRFTGMLTSIDATEGERLVMLMKNAVQQNHLPKALNTTRGQVIQLIESGLLPTLKEANLTKGYRGVAVAGDVVQGFLDDLCRHARLVDRAPAGSLGIPQAAQMVFTPSMNIVRLILDGSLTQVFQLVGISGYGGIRVDPDEVGRIAKPEMPEVAMPACRIATRLGLKLSVTRALLMDRKGGPLLPSIPGNAKVKALVMVDVADAFARDHVGLMRLSKETRIHYVALRNKLDAAGVRPIDDPARLGTWIYRRSEIPDL